MSKAFEVVVLKPGEHLEAPPRTIQLRPSRMFWFPHGDVNDEPSLLFHMAAGDGTPCVVAQLSLNMLLAEMPTFLLGDLAKAINLEMERRTP